MATYPIALKDYLAPSGFSVNLRTGEPHSLVLTKLRGSYTRTQFRNDSAALLPVSLAPDDPTLPSGLEAVAIALRHAELSPGRKLLLSGHTDEKGGTSDNTKLSQIRAEAVQGMLIGDRDQFARACFGPHLTAEQRYPSSNDVRGVLWDDYIDVLRWVEDTLGWACAYSTRSTLWNATCKFQQAYNDNRITDFPKRGTLSITGKFDLETWKAVFDCYDFHLFHNRLKGTLADLDKVRGKVRFVSPEHPFVACGESKPFDPAASTKAVNPIDRRVQIAFFNEKSWNAAADLPCMSGDCTPRSCPYWHDKWTTLEPLAAKTEDNERQLVLYLYEEGSQDADVDQPRGPAAYDWVVTIGEQEYSGTCDDGRVCLSVADSADQCSVRWSPSDDPNVQGSRDDIHLFSAAALATDDDHALKMLFNLTGEELASTEQRIADFQRAEGLPDTGKLDSTTNQRARDRHAALSHMAADVEKVSARGGGADSSPAPQALVSRDGADSPFQQSRAAVKSKLFNYGKIYIDLAAWKQAKERSLMTIDTLDANAIRVQTDKECPPALKRPGLFRLGYCKDYGRPQDPFRFDFLKRAIGSGWDLEIRCVGMDDQFDANSMAADKSFTKVKQTLHKIGQANNPNKDTPVKGYTLAQPTHALPKQLYSPRPDRDYIYILRKDDPNNELRQDSIPHEFWGHWYLHKMGSPEGHDQDIQASDNILDPLGLPYVGKVGWGLAGLEFHKPTGFIMSYAENNDLGFNVARVYSPTEYVEPPSKSKSWYSDAWSDFCGRVATDMTNKKFSDELVFDWQVLSQGYQARLEAAKTLPSDPVRKALVDDVLRDILTQYRKLKGDQKATFARFVDSFELSKTPCSKALSSVTSAALKKEKP
jgi:hypothetical protein